MSLNLGETRLDEMSARIPISSRAKSEINQTRSSSDKDINTIDGALKIKIWTLEWNIDQGSVNQESSLIEKM